MDAGGLHALNTEIRTHGLASSYWTPSSACTAQTGGGNAYGEDYEAVSVLQRLTP